MNRIILVLILLLAVSVAQAKEATPMAADPELEKKVNTVSEELRCLVCQNQTISDSHAALAVDLKNQVREMLADGKTEAEVIDYMVERYGDFVRYRPPVKPTTMLLWAGPFLLLIVGGAFLFVNLKRRQARAAAESTLSEEESKKVESLMQAEKVQAEKENENKDN